jgi:uridine kinase
MNSPYSPFVVGIAGGTGSGKTTVAMAILERTGKDKIAYIQHDSYYKDLSELPPAQRATTNFDHPNSLDSGLMIEHIRQLKEGHAIEVPNYDFTTHTRKKDTQRIEPKAIVLVEGILLFAEPEMRDLIDIKFFVDTDSDLRIIRRIQRDIKERGRTTDSVIEQYESTVRPMHLEFVEPSKRYADLIIPEGGYNQVAMDVVLASIEARINQFEPIKNP